MLTAILALLVAGAAVILWGPAVALLLLLAAAHFLRKARVHPVALGKEQPRTGAILTRGAACRTETAHRRICSLPKPRTLR